MKKAAFVVLAMWYLLQANTTFAFTHADTLRGGNGPGRSWWDVRKYDLTVQFDTLNQRITGLCEISFQVLGHAVDSMQVDLQEPMEAKEAYMEVEGKNNRVPVILSREGNVCWLHHRFSQLAVGTRATIVIAYSGKPRAAVNPPWDGGFSWKKDSTGKAWIAVSCQGLGASVWWPCKDAQWDEPDEGVDIHLIVPEGMAAISNGRFKGSKQANIADAGDARYEQWNWSVVNPINNYDVSFYLGDYVHWHDTLLGEKGILDLDFWVLRQNEAKARKQFAVVKPMIHCFEYWMGPYPFYEDGYKLVDAPYLGMEHQGAVAYGNGYKMGYMGYDRTFTGIGMNFDYIIIHESGHEWFGNNVTAKDIADNWIHEGITTYSESLFAECLLGKEKAQRYCRGEWRNSQNDKPIIGPYGVNEEGSGDMYDKGAAMMYMIRQLANDDEKFRQMLRGLGQNFYHKTVTTQEVEAYIAAQTGLDLKAFFDQYLRQANLPVLEYYIKRKKLNYRFVNTVPGFTLPITVSAKDLSVVLNPTSEWQTIKWKKGFNVTFSKDFFFKTK